MDQINIYEHIFSLHNPALYGLLVVIILIIFLILLRRDNYKPGIDKTKELENENLKLMALFAEIDPDPILRVDNSGNIIGANNTAQINFKGIDLIGSKFSDLIPNIQINGIKVLNDEIVKVADRYFNMSLRRMASMGFCQVYLHDITDRINFEKQIKAYQKNLKNLRTRLDTYNETEKQRLGRELHDSIGQDISVLKIKLQKFQNDNRNEDNVNQFETLLSDIDNLSDHIRDISYQLRPRVLNEFGLYAALSSLIDSLNRSSSMNGMLSSNEQEMKFTADFELNIFRICQEAITNILRHSNCKNFFIQLIISKSELKIIISDDGDGFDTEDLMKEGMSSLGMLNMKERALNYNGELNIESSPNQGTTLFITFNKIEEFRISDTDNNS